VAERTQNTALTARGEYEHGRKSGPRAESWIKEFRRCNDHVCCLLLHLGQLIWAGLTILLAVGPSKGLGGT
jgi:hypothetical protein